MLGTFYYTGGVSLATSRRYSNGADWRDVAAHLVAFRAINSMDLEIRLTPASTRGEADIQLTIVATEPKLEGQEVKSLGSVSVTCSSTMKRTLEDALIQALYLLDGKLAAGEMQKNLSA